MSHSQRFAQIDIFCRVIDNFGDAGVLWRLARALKRIGHEVRLVIDDVTTLAPLVGFKTDTPLTDYKEHFDIDVCRWEVNWDTDLCPLIPAPIVLEGFACRLPESYEAKMSQMPQAPVWINVDYFSAEDWIEECHLMPSTHPQLGLTKTFFFPGVTDKSAGLTIEDDYEARRASVKRATSDHLRVLFFAYPYAPINELAQALAAYPSSLEVQLTSCAAGVALGQALEKLASPNLCITRLPFVTQEVFDELLWQTDVAFIRGEDSAARAMIAGVPTVWQIYFQEEDAHLVKLEALTQKMKPAFKDAALYDLWQSTQLDYNTGTVDAKKLTELFLSVNAWKEATQNFAHTLKSNGSLAKKISDFALAK